MLCELQLKHKLHFHSFIKSFPRHLFPGLMALCGNESPYNCLTQSVEQETVKRHYDAPTQWSVELKSMTVPSGAYTLAHWSSSCCLCMALFPTSTHLSLLLGWDLLPSCLEMASLEPSCESLKGFYFKKKIRQFSFSLYTLNLFCQLKPCDLCTPTYISTKQSVLEST